MRTAALRSLKYGVKGLDQDSSDHYPTSRLQLALAEFQNVGSLPSRPADEDGVGLWEIRNFFKRVSKNDVYIRCAEFFEVLFCKLHRLGINVYCKDLAKRPNLVRRLYRHRPASAPYVVYNLAVAQPCLAYLDYPCLLLCDGDILYPVKIFVRDSRRLVFPHLTCRIPLAI